ncbi:immunity-specific protein Beta371 [Corynebacterium ulcerans]|nr:immunity-specific protein Beta371 [Corynebacterium ulcerans]
MDPVIKLVAHAQEMSMTIPRRQACMVYGKLNVTLKKGDVQEERGKRVTDGYVHIPEDMPQGRFDFGFTREDADVNIGTGQSTYELALDTAARRITGQVLFEQDIIAPGFGDWRPLIDFSCGDLVGVRIWGKELVLPVTSITRETTGWRAHVGGQLINDRRKIISENRKILADIESERRERMNEIGAISSVASAASVAAKDADAKAETADGKAEDALAKWRQQKDQLDKVQSDLIEKNTQWNRIQDRSLQELEAQQTAMKRYVELCKPGTATAETWDPVWAGPVRITYPSGNKIQLYLGPSSYIVGASVLGVARVSALSSYSFSFTAEIKAGETINPRVGGFEAFHQVSVTVHPIVDFAAILSEERRKRGLHQ